jgi:uncharacterized protein YfbU (UPF0304 family)
MMKLSRTERLILSNQNRIMEKLYPEEAESLAYRRKALESGYELHYENVAEEVYEETLSSEECSLVLNTMTMYEMIQRSYDQLGDKDGIKEWAITFHGFDGNSETSYMGYARYFCEPPDPRFDGLRLGSDSYNSHMPMVNRYRQMVEKWEASEDKYNLTKDDIIRIIST